MTTTSSDKPRAESIDAAHQTSIDDTPSEAGKFPLTNNANKEVVLGEPKGQLSNAVNQIINEQETEIPVKINPISERDHETKLHLQDYLNLAEPIPIGPPLNYQNMITTNPGSRPVILDSPNPESEIPRESERSNTEDAAIDLEEEEEELEEDLEID
ncbi:hypothetical protein F2Q69_00042164 [Brassica cretica]|uniref:Uncharacterized protein n=1 Tax=Brassica cretica TaxID=69181 RepID=A0A8S9NSY2_BRACR|nr:hypothetical protein F2Q69_00042164 [Brassica cretica]